MKVLWFLLAVSLILASCQPNPTTAPVPSPSASAATGLPSQPEPSIAPHQPAYPLPAATPLPPLDQANLVPNPGVENGSQGQPASWHPDTYGGFQTEFSWRDDSAFSGKYYLSVKASNYAGNGDAKWVFDPQPLKGGQWYEYRDMHRSDGRSRMLYSCQAAGGVRNYYNAWQSEVSPGWSEDAFRFYLPQDCDVSVIHSLDRNGYLDTDHQSMRQVTARPFKETLVSITFDDIWKTSYTIGAPELEKRGYKGSYYVTQLYAENPLDLYANTDDVRDLARRGHEIGSHAHRHSYLSQLATLDIVEDMRREVAFLKTFGVTQSGLAYPFGDFSAAVENETSRFHAYARTSLAGLNDATTNRYKLRIIPVTIDTSTEELLSWLQAARETHTWIIYLFHDLGDPEPNHIYRTPLSQYTAVLDAIKAANLKVVTVADGLKQAGL